MAYCTVDDFRLITGIPDSLVNDTDAANYIGSATAQFNADVNFKVIRERIGYIDTVRQNRIDGSNRTFYVKYCKDWYIGDMNNDGAVTTDDIIVYRVYGTEETIMTVESIDPANGSFTLAEAPTSGSILYVTYMRAPIDEHTPHELVKQAVAYLAGAMACTAISAAKFKQFKIGDLTILSQLEGYVALKERYDAIVHRILRDNTALEVIEG